MSEAKTVPVRFWGASGAPADSESFSLDYVAVARAKAEAFGPKARLVPSEPEPSVDVRAVLLAACDRAGNRSRWAASVGLTPQ